MIFGTLEPMFVYNLGQGDAATVYLDHTTVESEWDPQEIEQKAITGKKYFKPLGDYASFKVHVALHKYGTTPGDIAAKFEEIYYYNHKDVSFFLHRDTGPAYPIGLFHITRIEPYYLNNLNRYDMLLIEFAAVEYVEPKLGHI